MRIAVSLGALASCCSCLVAGAARAQQAPHILNVYPGSSIRIWAAETGPDEVRADVLSNVDDTLRIRIRGNRRRPPREVAIFAGTVRRIDLNRGPGSRRRGALIGTVLGGAVGAASGAIGFSMWQTSHPDCPGCRFGPTPPERRQWAAEDRDARMKLTLLGGISGLAAGALIGSRIRPSRWERIPLPLKSAVVPAGPRGTDLAIAIAFQ